MPLSPEGEYYVLFIKNCYELHKFKGMLLLVTICVIRGYINISAANLLQLIKAFASRLFNRPSSLK
jgi:hypothetical protein